MSSRAAALRQRVTAVQIQPSPRLRASAALVVATTIWGTSAVAVKSALDSWPPLTLAAVRFVIALAILLPLVSSAGRRPIRGWTASILGLTGVSLFFLLYHVGLGYGSAANATLIHGGIPVLTALLSVAVLGERLTGGQMIGAAASLLGVALIVAAGTGSDLDRSGLGNLLIVGSAVSWAVYTIVSRRAVAGAGALAVVTGASLYGVLFLLPGVAVELAVTGLPEISRRGILLLLYLSLGSSALAYGLWGYGLRTLSASQAATFANLMPLTGVASAALFLHEPIGAVQLGGGAMILVGVWLATRRAGMHSPPKGTPS